MVLQRNALARYKSQADELRSENRKLREQLQEEKIKAQAFESSLRGEDKTMSADLAQKLKEKDAQIEQLKESLESLKAEYNKVYAEDQKIKKDLDSKLQDAEAKVNELKVQLRTIKGAKDDDGSGGAQRPKRN